MHFYGSHKCDWIYKNIPKCHKNWNPNYVLILMIHYVLSRGINCVAIVGQVCFHRGLFANPVKPCWWITGPVGPLGSTNQNWLCARLLPMAISAYPVVCVHYNRLLGTWHYCLWPNGRHGCNYPAGINICDWIYKNWPKCHKNWNPNYVLILMIHSYTVQRHQLCGYRWPGLLSQTAFCRPCEAMLVHYRSCWTTWEH